MHHPRAKSNGPLKEVKGFELQGIGILNTTFLTDPQSTKELGEGAISGFFSLYHPSHALYPSHCQDPPKQAPYPFKRRGQRNDHHLGCVWVADVADR